MEFSFWGAIFSLFREGAGGGGLCVFTFLGIIKKNPKLCGMFFFCPSLMKNSPPGLVGFFFQGGVKRLFIFFCYTHFLPWGLVSLYFKNFSCQICCGKKKTPWELYFSKKKRRIFLLTFSTFFYFSRVELFFFIPEQLPCEGGKGLIIFFSLPPSVFPKLNFWLWCQ